MPVPEPARGRVRIRVTAAAVNPVDIATREGLMNAVRTEGAFAAFIGAGPVTVRGVRVLPVHIHADGAALTGLSALAAAGKLTLRVADTYRLEDAAKAHERLQAGGLRGRLVLVP